MTLIDLSHPIEDGMAAYPGLPPVRIFPILDGMPRATGMTGEPSSISEVPSWPVTPEPISMRPSTASVTARISRPCHWRRSSACRA